MEEHKKKKRKKRFLIVLSVIVVLLIALRLALPSIVLKYVNKTLGSLKEYRGHVEDIDIALLRGAYKINGIHIFKYDSATAKMDTIPFFESKFVDLSVEWRALFKGRIVGELVVEEPVVNFFKGVNKDKEVKQDTADFQTAMRKMMPLTINHFEINKGRIRYVDPHSKPRVDIGIDHMEVTADNISSVNDSSKVLPATMVATGNAYGGTFSLNVKFDAMEKQPTFDLNSTITDVNMKELNPFFQAYGNFDVNKGSFGLFAECAAKDGAFNGYVKPLIKDLDVVQFNKEEGSVVQVAWEAVVGSAAEILQNQKKEQLGTKLPISGKFENPNTSLWTAINFVLRNAFVAALQPSVDNTINIGNADEQPAEKKTFLQKVFGKDDKKGDKKGDSKDDKKDDKKNDRNSKDDNKKDRKNSEDKDRKK